MSVEAVMDVFSVAICTRESLVTDIKIKGKGYITAVCRPAQASLVTNVKVKCNITYFINQK